MLTITAVLALTFFAGSFIFPADASKTIVPFSYTETIPVPKATNVHVTWTPDWHTNINRGTYRTSTYNGPLGTGTIYYEAIISVTHYDNLTTGYTTFNGHGNYREIITITNGPYGIGTLEGIRIMEWNFDISRPVSTRYHLWGTATYQHGTGDLDGTRMVVSIDTYQVSPNRISTYTGSIILP